MKIIITESQLDIVRWFIQNQKELDHLFKKITSFNFYHNYVMFRPLEDVVDRVVNELYNDWSYKHNSFSGEESIKEFLKDHYSKRIEKLYDSLKKEYPHHNF